MDLFGLGIAIFYFFIISKSYEWICKITRKEQIIFLCYTCISVLIIEEVISLAYVDGFALSKFLFPLVVYGYLRKLKKYDKYKGIFISLLLSLIYHSTHTFISVILSSITGDDFVLHYKGIFFLVVLLLTYFAILIIIRYFYLEIKYFDKDYLYPFFKKVIVAFVFLHTLSFVSDIVSTVRHLNSFGSILSTIVFICLLLIFFAMNSHKVQVEKEIALKQKKFEQKHLQTYTDEIVKLYNEIRGFRHDYASMLISLQTGINTGDMKEVENIFHNVLKKANLSLRSDDYTFFELNNVKDTALRSVMIQTIFKAREHEIEILFEVKDEIERLPMNLLDLVRVASVLLNNAVEGAAESTSKSINISLVNLENEIIFVIQNSRQSRHMNIEEIYEMGFSTKGKKRGLGLSNVKEIISKYEDIILETDITSNSFTQVLIFKRKEIL